MIKSSASAKSQPAEQSASSSSTENPALQNNLVEVPSMSSSAVTVSEPQGDTPVAPSAQNLVQADPLVQEARTFWRERARALVSDSPKAIDDAARQVLTVAGIVVGFYVNAVVRADFQTRVEDWWVKLFYISPILVLLLSITFGLMVFFPGDLTLNINSSTAGKLAHDLLIQRKGRRLRWASICLVAGILVLSAALLAYFLGDSSSSGSAR